MMLSGSAYPVSCKGGIMKPFKKAARILGSETGSSRQQLLLLVLLLIVGAFAYLYFFTGLIVPREQPAKTPPVAAAPEKKPLPPRPEQTASKETASAKGAATPAATVAKAEPPKQTPPPAKPEPAKPAAAPAKPEPAKQPVPPAKPAAPVKPEPAKPAAVAKVEPAKAPAAKPEVKKPGAPVKEAVKQGAPAPKTVHGAYMLQIGDVAADEVSKVRALLKKLGITPVAQKHVKNVKPMNRLFVADFAEHSGADAELQRVKKATADAFILPAGERYAVYAGSYLSEKRALSEKNRLGTQGVKSSIQKSKVSVPLVRISAGNFSDRAAASAAGKSLSKHGVTARVVKKS